MITTKPEWNMMILQDMQKEGELRFDYPIQRKGGQWDDLQRGLLLHSAVGNYPIPPIAVAKAEVEGVEGEYVIDGRQRTTNILDYMTGIKNEFGAYPFTAYPIHEDTPDVRIGKKSYVLAGKYYDELDDVVQMRLKSFSFGIFRLEDATDEEIQEIFDRWNNGTPLTKQQKARSRMGTKNAIIFSNLVNHEFMKSVAQFTPLQRRRSSDETIILQTMMLMDQGSDFEGYNADQILKYASSLNEKDISPTVDRLTKGLDYLLSLDKKTLLFRQKHLSSVFMVAIKASEEGLDRDVFIEWLDDFNNAITKRSNKKSPTIETDYLDFTGAGSVKKKKALGRLNSMLDHFRKFSEKALQDKKPSLVSTKSTALPEEKKKEDKLIGQEDLIKKTVKKPEKKTVKPKATTSKSDNKAKNKETKEAKKEEIKEKEPIMKK